MAKLFENKFLSGAGQKERLANIGATLKAAVTGKGVKSNTGSKVVDTVLSKAASNPFGTAALAAVAVSPSTALAAVKTAPKTTIAATLAAPIVTSIAVSNPKGTAQTIGQASNLSQDVSNFAGNIASIKSGSDVLTTIEENPVLSAATVIGAGLVVKGAVGAAATAINTEAVRENTKVAAAAGASAIGAAMPALSDNQTKFVDSSVLPSIKNTAPSTGPLTASTSGAVNIQQNNYFSEKFIKKNVLNN